MKQDIKELEINGVLYIPKDSIKNEIIEFTGEKTIASMMIGRSVIVRSSNEGINIGKVELADETGIILTDCRRLYYHKPKDLKLSWYEGVAMSGLNKNSKVSGTVDRKVIIEKYSMTECNDLIYQQILNFTPNEQN